MNPAVRDLLYPECPSCGARDGIAKAILGPEDADGDHDVERLELACGHVERDPSMRMSATVVQMVRLSRPDVIEVRRPV